MGNDIDLFQSAEEREEALKNRKAMDKAVRQAAKRAGMIEAHQQYGWDIFNAKLELLESLRKHGLDENGENFDPGRMKANILRSYMSCLRWFEDRGFGTVDGGSSGDTEADKLAKNVVAILAEMRQRNQIPDV